MDKVKTIIRKEWAEVFKNRLVLFTVLFLPLIMVALPLGTLAAMDSLTGAELSGANEIPQELLGQGCAGLSEAACAQVFMLDLYTMMLMILPVAIPVTIAAYSIVGEKTSRSLEPLLATPITTTQLVVGKALAAILPAILATWIAYAIYLLGARLLTDAQVFAQLVEAEWLLAIFLVSPLLTLMSVSAALMISSRVSDPRVAEQLSALVILPLIMVIVGQSVGWLLIDQRLILMIGLIVAAIDAALLYFSIRLFQRETILTRWK